VVVVPPDAAVGEPGPVLICDDGSEYARRAEAHAQALSARLGRGVDRVAVETGDPVEQIAAAAAERRACVVVAGTRGRSQLTWRVFGSVCEGLVRAAGRPVMLVSAHAHEPA
jgi:nucleotide-binding universal stress UspA family protein